MDTRTQWAGTLPPPRADAQSCAEQNQRTGHTNDAIGRLEGNTQQHVALAQEFAAAAAALREQARALVGSLALFVAANGAPRAASLAG